MKRLSAAPCLVQGAVFPKVGKEQLDLCILHKERPHKESKSVKISASQKNVFFPP